MENYINNKLYYYFLNYFIDNIIKYKVYKIYSIKDSPINLGQYTIFSFDVAKKR